jgi:hypothetical protein
MPSADLAAPALVIFSAACRVFPVSGLGFAAIYPVVVVIAAQYVAKDQRLFIGGGIGAFLFPFAMSTFC